jgi:MATE family, multidrug efflux pump
VNDTLSLQRRYLRLAGPNILSNLLVPLASLVDTALLGHLAEIQFLGGVALAAVLFDYVFWSFGFLRMSTTGLVAQCRGRSAPREELQVGLRAVTVGLVSGLLVLLFRETLGDLGFSLLAGDSAVESAGRDYYRWRVLGAPFALMNFALLGWFLGREESRSALVMAAAGQGTNIILDLIFIQKMGWAAAGAGAATALSQIVMLVVAIALLWRHGRDLPWRLWRAELSLILRGRELRPFFRLSGDITIRTLLLVSTFAVFTNVAATMGAIALAATAVLRGVVLIVAYFVDGFAFATESLAGVYHGGGQKDQLRKLLRLSLAWGIAMSAAALMLFLLVPRPLLGLLTDHQDVIDAAIVHLFWLAPVLLFSAPAYVFDGFFLGITRGALLRRAMAVSVILGFAPWAIWAWRAQSLTLLWLSLSLFMLLRTISLGLPARREVS